MESVCAILWAMQEKREKEHSVKVLPKFGPLEEGADGPTYETLA